MAVDMFLIIDGKKIDGESKDDVFSKEKALDVLAWAWGASNSGTMHTGGGGGAGKANVQDVSVTSYFEKSSAKLLEAVCLGSHHSKIRLVVRKAGGKQLPYIDLTMEECMVTSFSTGGSGGEDRLTCNFSINFAKYTIKYTEQDQKGGKLSEVEVKYNIAANVA